MALDLEKIRARVAQLEGAGRKTNINFWKPEPGEYTVRVLPWKDNDGQPFKERWFYYNIGTGPGILAPTQFQKPDPIQELITKLHSTGKKEDKELAKKLYPKMRVYAPMVVRGEESKGVFLWTFGKPIYTRLLGFILDAEVGDITDVSEGYDLKVKVVESTKNFNGRKVFDTTVDAARKPSKLMPDSEKATTLLNAIPNIDEYFKLKSYDEIKRTLDQWLDGGAQDPNQSAGTEGASGSSGEDELDKLAREVEETKPAAEAKATKAPKSNGKKVAKAPAGDDAEEGAKKFENLDAAFDDLLND